MARARQQQQDIWTTVTVQLLYAADGNPSMDDCVGGDWTSSVVAAVRWTSSVVAAVRLRRGAPFEFLVDERDEVVGLDEPLPERLVLL